MIIALVAGIVTTANAQTDKDYEAYPHWFIGVQGGAAMTLNSRFDNTKQITPTGSFSIGWHPIQEVAIRLNANGIWSKSGIEYTNIDDDKYGYKYVTGDIDALINLVGIFGKKDYYPVNLYLVAGCGYNRMWDNKEAQEKAAVAPLASTFIYPDNDLRQSFNMRTGLLLDVSLGKHWSVNLEADYNYWANSKTQTFVIDHKQITAQLGLAYKFGYKKKHVEPEPEPVAEPAPAPAPKPAPAPVVKKEEPKPAPKKLESMKENVFFTIGKSDAKGDEAAKIQKAAEWLKNHPSANATVTGYADKGTGTAKINKKLAEQRATKVADQLKKAGVNADRLYVDSKGDTVQPFANNDDNRVAIIVAEEK